MDASDRSSGSAAIADRIPAFSSIEEAAEFFDTHDSADFADEWEEVTDVRFEAARPKGGIWLRLDDDTLTALTALARAQATSPASLVRRWIRDHLAATRSR